MGDWLQDVRYALRGFWRDRGFTLAALLALALGTGANTAMFSALSTLLLRPLPYAEPQELVSLFETRKDKSQTLVALATFEDWQSSMQSLSALAAYRPRTFGLRATTVAEPEVVSFGMTTAAFFDVLAVVPEQGRAYSRDEEIQGATVVLISHELWQRQFGGRPILGQSLLVNDVPHQVIGIVPPGLRVPMENQVPEAFIPISHKDYGGSRGIRALEAIGRLAPGSSMEAARAEVETLAGNIAQAHPDTNAGTSAGLRSLHEALRGKNRRPLVLLMAAGALLLVIACSSVANLLVARAAARQREVVVRAALGASFWHLLRAYFAEGVVLACFGAGLGLLVAKFCLEMLPRALPLLGGTSFEPVRLDATAFLFSVGITGLVSVLFALAPSALARKVDLERVLRSGTSTQSAARLRSALVIAQIALSLMLLLGAGLLLRSFYSLVSTDPGFDSTAVLRFGIGLPEVRYDSDAKLAGFHEKLLVGLRAIPGVSSVGAAIRLPVSGALPRVYFEKEGVPVPREDRPAVGMNLITPGYLETLHIPLQAGRPLSDRDTLETPRVMLVNATLARAYFSGESPIGKRLTLNWTSERNPKGTAWEIVGVTGDTLTGLEQEPHPEMLLSMSQFPAEGASYVVRTSRLDGGLEDVVRAAVRSVDAQLERINLRPMSEAVSASLSDRRLGLGLTGAFAGVALFLTAVGIHGIVAFNVAQRRREIGIRMALGAQLGQVSKMVLAHGLRLAGTGILLGWLAAAAFARVLAGQLHGVGPLDPLTYLAVGLVLAVTALLACALPARRAARTEPRIVLTES